MFRKKSAQSAAPKKAGRFAQVRQVFTATRGAYFLLVRERIEGV